MQGEKGKGIFANRKAGMAEFGRKEETGVEVGRVEAVDRLWQSKKCKFRAKVGLEGMVSSHCCRL